MKIRVHNSYSDGHESTLEYNLPDHEIPTDSEEMWEFLYQYTGDGHGLDRRLGFCYEITIVDAARPELIGMSEEWVG